MTPYDRQIRNILWTIAVLLCIVIVCLVWALWPPDHKQQAMFDVSLKDYKLLHQPGLNDFIVRVEKGNMSILAADSFANRCQFDIDPGEMAAMSTDSLHPDAALLWRDRNNITHLSYNFTKK